MQDPAVGGVAGSYGRVWKNSVTTLTCECDVADLLAFGRYEIRQAEIRRKFLHCHRIRAESFLCIVIND
jgi:hypothetical protein